MKSRTKRNYHLATLILSISLGILLLVTAIFAVSSYISTQKMIKQEVDRSSKFRVKVAESSLVEILKSSKRSIESIVAPLQFTEYSSKEKLNNIKQHLEVFYQSSESKYFDLITLVDNDSNLTQNFGFLDSEEATKFFNAFLNSQSMEGNWQLILIDTQNSKNAALINSQPIIEAEFGQVLGYIIYGIKLNNNASIMNEIRAIAEVEAVNLMVKNQVIATSFKKEKLSKKDLILPYQKITEFHFKNKPLSIQIHMKNTVQRKLDAVYINNLWVLLFCSLLAAVVMFILLNRITGHGFSSLIQYAQDLKNSHKIYKFQLCKIEEFNVLGQSLEEMMTSIHESNKALHESEQFLRSIMETIPDQIWLKDPEGRFMACNPCFEQFMNHKEADIIGKTDYDYVDKELADYFVLQDKVALDAGSPIISVKELCFVNDGHYEYIETIKTPMYMSDGELIGILGIGRNISKRKDDEEKITYLAHHDSLTGLPNRLLFSSLFEVAIKRQKRSQSQLALFFIDLDKFKHINDSLGHNIGDEVLKRVSQRFAEILREDDVVARWGGDEFILYIEDISSHDDMILLAEKLIAAFKIPIYEHHQQELFVGVSIGISIYPDDSDNCEKLIQYADIAMYKAKDAGRNCLYFHSSIDNIEATRRLQLEIHLRKAISNNELYVVYQPKIDAQNYEIEGAEALVRWKNPELGEVYPDEFIPIAESMGIIQELGKFVLEEALKQVSKWRKLVARDLTVAVNFSPHQFMVEGLEQLIFYKIKQANLPFNALEVEITESLLLNHNEKIKYILNALSEKKISIAIDDFGTGYSALSYLKNFPINVVKIDRTFIKDISNNPEDAVLVKTIILMAHGLGMSVVAEGIETKQQLSFYQVEQGDLVQGYYFSKPLEAESFIKTLTNWDAIKHRSR